MIQITELFHQSRIGIYAYAVSKTEKKISCVYKRTSPLQLYTFIKFCITEEKKQVQLSLSSSRSSKQFSVLKISVLKLLIIIAN
jgi:hypothetical protein